MVKHRNNFVAIQVKPYAWVDEGIDALLDTVQQKGAVNTIWAYTYDFAEAHMNARRHDTIARSRPSR